MPERRAAQRFDLQLPLRVHVSEGQEAEKSAETRDISHRGVYFWFDRTLDPGSEFEFLMELPQEMTGTIPVQIRCIGKVIRSLPQQDGRIGIAAVIERYEFIRSSNAANPA